MKDYTSKVKSNPPKFFGNNNKSAKKKNLFSKLKIEKNLYNNINNNINKDENINKIDNNENIDELDLNKDINLNLNYISKESERDIFNVINNKNKNIRKQEHRKSYINYRKNIRTKKKIKTQIVKISSYNLNTIGKETKPKDNINIIKNDINKNNIISNLITLANTTN